MLVEVSTYMSTYGKKQVSDGLKAVEFDGAIVYFRKYISCKLSCYELISLSLEGIRVTLSEAIKI